MRVYMQDDGCSSCAELTASLFAWPQRPYLPTELAEFERIQQVGADGSFEGCVWTASVLDCTSAIISMFPLGRRGGLLALPRSNSLARTGSRDGARGQLVETPLYIGSHLYII